MSMWADGTIYCWHPELDLYMTQTPGVFTVIPVLAIITQSLLESPLVLENLLESLGESWIQRAALQKEWSHPLEAFCGWITFSLWKL
jgi:hypothetical protein